MKMKTIIVCSTFGPVKASVPANLSNREIGALIVKNKPVDWDEKDIEHWAVIDEISDLGILS